MASVLCRCSVLQQLVGLAGQVLFYRVISVRAVCSMQTGMRMQYLQSFSCRHDFASSDFRLDLKPDVYCD